MPIDESAAVDDALEIGHECTTGCEHATEAFLRFAEGFSWPRDGGHGYGGIEGTGCITDLITALIETGSVAGLDTAACATGMKRQPFVLAREPEVELPADQLARLGRATAIVYERPGQPAQTLARKGA